MRSRARFVSFASLFLALAASACTVTTTNPGASSSSSSSGSPGSDTDSGAPVPDSGAQGPLGFNPSNVNLTEIDLTKAGDVDITETNCLLDTDQLFFCADDTKYSAKTVTLADQSRVAVFAMHSLRVEQSSVIHVRGKVPAVLVVEDTVVVLGGILVEKGAAGGAINSSANAKGVGPGGGPGGASTGSPLFAGSGGSFCGVGGAGSSTTGAPNTKAAAYGTPELVPLVAGSAGGTAALGDSGEGGGAIQITAGTSIQVVAGGSISAPGGGGIFGGTTTQEAGGGGSGGAILLEAKTVTIAGTLAANGGGGGQGSGDSGEDGHTDAAAALGGQKATYPYSFGGAGSMATDASGKDGAVTATYAAGGGGGGAGRIRINTASGQATTNGATISPAVSTGCASVGTIK